VRNNRATWIFLSVLFVFLAHASIKLRLLVGSSIYPLMIFVVGLYSALSFFEKINKKDLSSRWFRLPAIGRGLLALRGGEQIPFWHRQLIFYGGFCAGWGCLVVFG
jgi:hypothetical protein